MDKLEPSIKALREFLANDKVLSVSAVIGKEDECADCTTNWHYRPLRRKFSIADVSGDLRNIEFRCEWQGVVDEAREGSSWDLPEDWGNCSIIVFGKPGTTFDLLEWPSASAS